MPTDNRRSADMTFSRQQNTIAWTCLATMAGMLVYPPWFWDAGAELMSTAQFSAGYDWIWAPPSPPAPYQDCGWTPVIFWGRLLQQWLCVGVGMVLLLFLREADERSGRVDAHRADTLGAGCSGSRDRG